MNKITGYVLSLLVVSLFIISIPGMVFAKKNNKPNPPAHQNVQEKKVIPDNPNQQSFYPSTQT